ncbi:MAG: ATP-dependent DNA helicase, partial [Pseudonocardiaceae bacterium]
MRELFSSRRGNIGPLTAQLGRAFEARYGRQPSPLERFHLAQQATLATRQAKSHHGETLEARLDRWTEEAHQLAAGGLQQLARTVLAQSRDGAPVQRWEPRDVIERALATIGDKQATFTRSDLLAAIGDALPAVLDVAPEQVWPLLDTLTDQALQSVVQICEHEPTDGLPAQWRLSNGISSLARPGETKYATAAQLVTETVLRRATAGQGAAALTAEQAHDVIARFAESGKPLNAGQAAALTGILTSGARVETLSAAAGTGKSFLMGVLAEAWRAPGTGRVFGLAAAENAAKVLTAEGVTAKNVTAWLACQQRLDDHHPTGDDTAFALHAGDIVAIDEASMIATGQLAEVHRRVEAAGAKLLLTGDPRQLGAVGPGGAMADLTQHGLTYELTDVRRFTNDWEGPASLRLREGDTSVLAEYHRHGQLIDGGTVEETEAAAARAWLADTLAGKDSLLVVPTNTTAQRINACLRNDLIRLGKVTEAGVLLGEIGGYNAAGVGDLIQARRNGWELIGFDGNTTAPINREAYRVTAIRADGGLTVAPVLKREDDGEVLGDTFHLSADYVKADVSLAYSSTQHTAQGRTVDTGHSIAGPGVNAEGLYVGATRGEQENTIWTVTQAVPTDAAPGQTPEVQTRSARAVVSDILEGARRDPSALRQQADAQTAAVSTLKHGDQLISVAAEATAGRTSALLDRLAAQGVLPPSHREALAADDSTWSLERLLRTAEIGGHDPTEVLAAAVSERDLDGARHPAQVLYARIENRLRAELTPTVSSYQDLIPRDLPEEWRPWVTARAQAADQRRQQLGEQIATEAPQWAVEALGAPPEDPTARAE